MLSNDTNFKLTAFIVEEEYNDYSGETFYIPISNNKDIKTQIEEIKKNEEIKLYKQSNIDTYYLVSITPIYSINNKDYNMFSNIPGVMFCQDTFENSFLEPLYKSGIRFVSGNTILHKFKSKSDNLPYINKVEKKLDSLPISDINNYPCLDNIEKHIEILIDLKETLIKEGK
jgi:hypothetical protein